MPRLTNEEICKQGWERANQMIVDAIKEKTNEERNNNLDILRHTALSLIAIDMANAARAFKWKEKDFDEYLSGIMGIMIDLSSDFNDRINKGLSTVLDPKKTETMN